jgi:hypothetical protein
MVIRMTFSKLLLPVLLLALLATAPPAFGFKLKLESTERAKPFKSSSCKADHRSLYLPPGARNVRAGSYDTANDSSTGTELAGPLAFYEQPSAEDEDDFGDYAIEFYASITGFRVRPDRATWTITAEKKWCAGYTGDPKKQAPPKPASEQAHPENDPTYHKGWITQRYDLNATYTLERKKIFTVDPRGTVRSRAPRTFAASKKYDIKVRDITWKNWGKAEPTGKGTATYNGKTYKATLYADLLDIGHAIRGCRPGQVYYAGMTVYIPKLASTSTNFQIGRNCTDGVLNGSSTIDEAIEEG